MDIGSILLTLVVTLGMVLIGVMALLPTWFEIASRRRDAEPGGPSGRLATYHDHLLSRLHRSRV